MSFDFDATAITAKRFVDIGLQYDIHKNVCGLQNSHKPLCGSFPGFCHPQNLQDTQGGEDGQA